MVYLTRVTKKDRSYRNRLKYLILYLINNKCNGVADVRYIERYLGNYNVVAEVIQQLVFEGTLFIHHIDDLTLFQFNNNDGERDFIEIWRVLMHVPCTLCRYRPQCREGNSYNPIDCSFLKTWFNR